VGFIYCYFTGATIDTKWCFERKAKKKSAS